ncbi:MAG: Gfo/Idh/MocA family oxidoreductase [Lentisphaeria bacterium]
MLCRGHESWHPDPEFYYEAGGGPMFDMGPYYLTALVSLMGPVRRVTGSTRISMPTRTITSEKKNGKIIDVEVPTHVTGIMDFENGAIGTITTSFDVTAAEVPRIEIFGEKGTLSVPDPNTFGGTVKVKGQGDKEWREIPLRGHFSDNSRGIGVADMAVAAVEGCTHSANGELGFHILDIMQAVHDASDQERHIKLESTCERPPAFESEKLS